MKIFAPYLVRDIGGTSIFAKKFKSGLERAGHSVTFTMPEDHDYDLLFVIVFCLPHFLLDARLRGKKIVQRLDGVNYPSVAGWKYRFIDFPSRFINRFFADITIYQSKYSRHCVETFFGKSHTHKESIICNGVDTVRFSPDGERIPNIRDYPDQEIFFTASKFRRTDQIVPLIEAMKIYTARLNPKSKLLIAGSFSREVEHVPKTFGHLPFLRFLGKVPNNELPLYERSADLFLFTHLNPPCPNNILEALASGLPVCGIADGSMPELVTHGETGLLIPTTGDAFYERRTYDIEQFARNMKTLMNHRSEFSLAARKSAEERFTLERMIGEYIRIFEKR